MPNPNGVVSILGSAGAGGLTSRWIVLDQYSDATTIRAATVNTARGAIQGTLVDVGTLGTAAVTAGAIFILPAFASVSGGGAATTAVATTYSGRPANAIRVLVSAGTTGTTTSAGGIVMWWDQSGSI